MEEGASSLNAIDVLVLTDGLNHHINNVLLQTKTVGLAVLDDTNVDANNIIADAGVDFESLIVCTLVLGDVIDQQGIQQSQIVRQTRKNRVYPS